MKKILFKGEAQKSLKEGVDLVADVAKVTLGPKGLLGVVQSPKGINTTKDGITLANGVRSDDPAVQQGVVIARESSRKSEFETGDGSTTSLVLTQALVDLGIKEIEAGVNPRALTDKLENDCVEAILSLKELSIDVDKDSVEVEQVARVSANGDKEVSEVVSEAVSITGHKGAINVDKEIYDKTSVDTKKGILFGSGLYSGVFANNGTKCTYDEPLVVLISDKIEKAEHVAHIATAAIDKLQKPIVFICGDLVQDAYKMLEINRAKNLPICVVKSCYEGQKNIEYFNDLGESLGCPVLSLTSGHDLTKPEEGWFARPESIEVRDNETIIVPSEEDGLDTRLSLLKEHKDNGTGLDIDNRITALSGGAAVIKVGASTPVEHSEKVDRVVDAIGSARAAIEEGIVPGGGATYIELRNYLADGILKEALRAPFDQIIMNAGYEPKEYYDLVGGNLGVNAQTMEECDLLESGIIDSAKTVRVCIENAVSVAVQILKVGVSISIKADN